MLEMNSAEIFARGTLDWVATHSKNILKIWNTTVGWGKEASLPCHIITFSISEEGNINPDLPYFLGFENGSLEEDSNPIDKELWRDIIKSLLRTRNNPLGFVLVAESSLKDENFLLLSYEGVGDVKILSSIPFNLQNNEIIFQEAVLNAKDNILEENLKNIFGEKDTLN